MLVYVTAEQVQMYEDSKLANDSKNLFSKFEGDPSTKLTRTFYCSTRDHLYSVIHFATSHRSGVTANMTMSEYAKAKKSGNDLRIKVWDHKTVDYYGPAAVVRNHSRIIQVDTCIRDYSSPKLNYKVR